MPRAAHFEIHAEDPERAAKFHEKVFNWKTSKGEGPVDPWLVATGEDKEPGVNGAIMHRVSKGSTWNTIDVPSVDEFVQKIVKAGRKVVQKKTAVPGVVFMAYCVDTEGNVFGSIQEDTKAK